MSNQHMTILRKINNKIKNDEATGFGANSKDTSGRFYLKSGTPNVKKNGLSIFERLSWYHAMINMSTGRFLLLIFSGYISINLLFTGVYALIGIDNLAGINKGTPIENFMEIFFFSTQTFTTVGYGRISPVGMLASSMATFEAFIGLLSFAIATGLFYGRFSRPKAHLRFSKNALISPFNGGKAIMFRLAPFKNNYLTDVEVKLTLAVKAEENGQLKNKFYILETQISRINMLIVSWTVVHPINENSPFFGLETKEIRDMQLELMVFIKGFDEAYSNAVVSRTSYLQHEIIPDAKFRIMYHPDQEGSSTILDFDLLDSWDPLS